MPSVDYIEGADIGHKYLVTGVIKDLLLIQGIDTYYLTLYLSHEHIALYVPTTSIHMHIQWHATLCWELLLIVPLNLLLYNTLFRWKTIICNYNTCQGLHSKLLLKQHAKYTQWLTASRPHSLWKNLLKPIVGVFNKIVFQTQHY